LELRRERPAAPVAAMEASRPKAEPAPRRELAQVWLERCFAVAQAPPCGCDTATPAQQLSNTSEELLRSSKRLLRLPLVFI
jgi:hypothetical protein